MTDFNFTEAHVIQACFIRARTQGLSAETTMISDGHIYKHVWTPVVNEELSCRIKDGVAFIKSGIIVGHVQVGSQLPVTYSYTEEVMLCAKLQIYDIIPATRLRAT